MKDYKDLCVLALLFLLVECIIVVCFLKQMSRI